jgi:alkanesulfonate monooxygenase SsuD/methylene tetrahydromethanopterin reductase-like flavin-dependent oxidoreductase (luciferase family)
VPGPPFGYDGDVRFGVFLSCAQFPGRDHGSVLRETVAAARAAEAAGFDDVWLAEHHFMSYGVCPSATTLAGFVLGATSRIGVGTAVSVLSTQHPVALAEQAAVLALVSDGRFRLGVGRGGPWIDLEVFGTGLDRYEHGFAESLDLLLAWLRADRLSWSGKRFRFREVPVVPRAEPPPPVVVACTSRRTEVLAAERGLPMLLGMHAGDEDKAAAVRRYAAAAERSGRPPAAPHIATGVGYVADSRAEAVTTLCRELPRWLAPGLAGYVPVDDRPRPRRDPHAYTRLLCGLHPVGTPDDCAASIEATMTGTGIGHLILLVEAGAPERTLANIARLGAEVRPVVRARMAAAGRDRPEATSPA